MSPDARLMIGISLIVVPTIQFGGLTLLGVVTGGAYGAPGPQELTPLQQSLYRAGHAHAGVILILSVILQILLDHAALGSWTWPVRIAAPAAAVLMSGGFFGLAHVPALRVLLYVGAALLAVSTVMTGIGLIRSRG
jgi:hypothetical protein